MGAIMRFIRLHWVAPVCVFTIVFGVSVVVYACCSVHMEYKKGIREGMSDALNGRIQWVYLDKAVNYTFHTSFDMGYRDGYLKILTIQNMDN